jgi:hypothetical protein
VLSHNSNLTPAEVTALLQQSADDRGAPGKDPSFGWGRVNAARALGSTGGSGDTQAPTVSFTAPVSGATVSGTVSIQVAASDNTGVASVSLSVDGVIVATGSTAPYSFSWNSTTVANGPHTLTATARDAAGNTALSSVTVTVNNAPADTVAPSVSITSPAAGARVSGNVVVTVSASDNVGVVKVELYVDGVLKATSIASPFTTKWNSRQAAPGNHTLQTKAYDAAGNSALSAPVTVSR